jgi:prepilin peptidase CpaA
MAIKTRSQIKMIPLVVYSIILLELFPIVFFDIKYRKISNYWSLLNFVLFFILLFVFKEKYTVSLLMFKLPGIFLLAGLILYKLKMVGAGDVKYIFSLLFLVPLSYQGEYLTLLGFTSVAYAIVNIFIKYLREFDTFFFYLKTVNIKGMMKLTGKKVPFAPAMLMAWIWFGWMFQKLIF